jgi:hypothetical protein
MRPIYVYTKNTDESVSCEWGQSGVDFHTSSLNATIDKKDERQAAHTKRKERRKKASDAITIYTHTLSLCVYTSVCVCVDGKSLSLCGTICHH